MKKVIWILSFILLVGVGITIINPKPVRGALALTQTYITNWPARFNIDIANSSTIPAITGFQKWNYLKMQRIPEISQDEMNQLGQDGWELFSYEHGYTSGSGTWSYTVFKRPIQ